MQSQQLIRNRYILQDLLGRGGMGVVYSAYDRLKGHQVALKQVTVPTSAIEHASRAHNSDYATALAQEFRVLASIRHPNIISVYDYGFDQDQKPYFTMPLVDHAQPIDLATKGMVVNDRIKLIIDLLQAVGYLHQRGIMHRDLKPSNVLVRDKQILLLDFGLALDATFAQNASDMAGTLAYMAPELLQGGSSSARSDLYAIAVIACYILTGSHPFDGNSQTELIKDILLSPPKSEAVNVVDGLRAILLRLLSKSPSDRYEKASQVIEAICDTMDWELPPETDAIRDSFLQSARFVGRTQQMKLLESSLDDLNSNKGKAWIIGGESGVGKSRLMDELRIKSLVRGFTTITGQAITNGGLPFQLWREIARHLLLNTTLEKDDAFLFSLLVPDIERFVGYPVTKPYGYIPRSTYDRLRFLFADLIMRITLKQPLILLLEDLQWAGEGLSFLKELIPLTKNYPLLIIANYRSDEAPHLHEELNGMQLLTIERLSFDETLQFSSSILGASGEQLDVVELIQRETEGNIFFIIEVVRTLAEEVGRLSDIGRSTLPAQVFSGSVQRIIERRFARLPEYALEPLQYSAVIGREISFELLPHLLPELNIQQWLNHCSDHAILNVSDEKWQFAHDKIREQLLQQLDDSTRATIHQRVADTIEMLYSDHLAEYSVVLARHYQISGDTVKEGRYAILAAEHSVYINFFDTFEFAERAITLEAHRNAPNSAQVQCQMFYILGQAATRLGRFPEAKVALTSCVQYASAMHDLSVVARAQNVLGEIALQMGEYDVALPLVENSLGVFKKGSDWRHMGYAYMNLGIIAAENNRVPDAYQFFSDARDAFAKIDDEIPYAQSLGNLAIIHDMQGEFEQSLRLQTESLNIRRKIRDRIGIAYSLSNMATLFDSMKRYTDAEAHYLEALMILREMGNLRGIVSTLHSFGNHYLHLKNYDKARDCFLESLTAAHGAGLKRHVVTAAHKLVMASIHIGKGLSQLDSYLRQALSVALELKWHSYVLQILMDIVEIVGDNNPQKCAMILAWLAQQESIDIEIASKAQLQLQAKNPSTNGVVEPLLSVDQFVNQLLNQESDLIS